MRNKASAQSNYAYAILYGSQMASGVLNQQVRFAETIKRDLRGYSSRDTNCYINTYFERRDQGEQTLYLDEDLETYPLETVLHNALLEFQHDTYDSIDPFWVNYI